MSAESKVLRALRKRNRVTRKTAIERGWAENLLPPSLDCVRWDMILYLSWHVHLKERRTHAIV